MEQQDYKENDLDNDQALEDEGLPMKISAQRKFIDVSFYNF